MREIPLILFGFGNVGQSIVRLIAENAGYRDEGLRLTVHAVFDRQGGVETARRNLGDVLDAKRVGGSVITLPGAEHIELGSALEDEPTALLVDCSATDAVSGGPGLTPARQALGSGHSVVFASKGPLVARYAELSNLAVRHGGRLGASAAVGIPLPSLEASLQGVRGAALTGVRGMLNETANQILRALEAGTLLADALASAREAGTIEADPSLDLGGWDAAYKLLILARAIWDPNLLLSNVEVSGVDVVGTHELAEARSEDRRIRLVASGTRSEVGTIRLAVRPEPLLPDDPLHPLGPGEKGLILQTRDMGRIALTASGSGPRVTAACVLKDVLNIVAPPGL